MTNSRSITTAIAAIAFATSGVLPSVAQLPSLDVKPWFGYHAVFANTKYRFAVAADGQITVATMLGRDNPIGQRMLVTIDIVVEEVGPDGKATIKKIKPETLASNQPATAKLQKATITGKVTGDASFEISIEQQRDAILIGGRLLDRGTLTKNPLRFSIHCDFPDPYYSAKTNAREKDPAKAAKALEKTMEKDLIELTLADKKRKKLTLEEKIGNSNPEIDGPGIVEAEVAISSYKGRRFLLKSSADIPMKLWNPQTRPLHAGFSFIWAPDPTKDKDGKARLSIEVK